MATAATSDKTLVTSDLCELFHVTPHTIWKWSREGRLPRPVKVGRSFLWRASDVHAYLASLGRGEGVA